MGVRKYKMFKTKVRINCVSLKYTCSVEQKRAIEKVPTTKSIIEIGNEIMPLSGNPSEKSSMKNKRKNGQRKLKKLSMIFELNIARGCT